MNLGETMVVSSCNCRGIQNTSKCRDVLDYLQSTDSNIICLQDTHLIPEQERAIKSFWENEFILHGTKTNARGVAIFFNRHFEYKILNAHKDNIGNMLTLDLLIHNEFTIRLINTYAPNQDQPDFFDTIQELIDSNTLDYLIICGDMNLALDQQLDCYNYQHINNPKSRTKVLKLLNQYNMVDVYRHLFPNKKTYTWKRQNPTKKARLDYFLVTNQLLDSILESEITSGYRTDHSMIKLKLQLNKFEEALEHGNSTVACTKILII